MNLPVDLLFPVLGTELPTDHGYMLYSSLCRLLPCLHDGTLSFGMLPVTGRHVGQGLLHIDSAQSRLRLRLGVADIPRVLPLAGKKLAILGHHIRLGVPQIEALQPVPALIARTVTIKNATEVEAFLDAARRLLVELGIQGNARVPEHFDKTGRPEPLRRVVRIKDATVIGYSLLVEGLNEADSLKLQVHGLGGRRHMGCGLFVPARSEENGDGV